MYKYVIGIEERFKVIEKYLNGLSTSELSKEYNVNSETIRNILIKNNIKRRPQPNIRPPVKTFKICTCCKKELPNSITYFMTNGKYYKNGDKKLRSFCRKCSHNKSVIYTRNRRINDLEFKLRGDISSRIRHAIKRNTAIKQSKTIILLGCTIKELRNYLEQQFRDDMTWENYGNVWHIDHVKPCSSFNLLLPDEQEKCFHYTNLQPLLAKENLSKSSYYNGVRYHNFNKTNIL